MGVSHKANPKTQETNHLLAEILIELKMIRMHLEEVTGNKIINTEVE